MAGSILRPLAMGKVRPHQPTGHEIPPVNNELSLTLEAAPNTLAICPSGDLVAVGGRKIFLLCRLDRERGLLTPDKSLRDLPPKKAVNLNYSTLDIQWRPGNVNQLVSASPNGSVVLWNLQKGGKNKIEHVFSNHERTVNALCFHPRDDTQLLSGSQDMTTRLFDLRSNQEACCFKGPDAVRDVKFFPSGKDYFFTAAFDNGVVQFWDTRTPDTHVQTIAAHSGPVYSCEWLHEKETVLVTGGRDKNIRVFEVAGNLSAKSTSVISTILPVSKVHWRPSSKAEIASCYQILDSNISVWSTARPYIPSASFHNHGDVVTDFLWLNEKEILSCSKDNRLLVQTMSFTSKPVDHVSPISLSVGSHGEIAFSSRSSQTKTSSASRNPASFRSEPEDHRSALIEYKTSKIGSQSTFVECARRFAVCGSSVEELCQTNAKVCEDLHLQDKATTWRVLELLSHTPPCPPKVEVHQEPHNIGERRRHVSGRSGPDISLPSLPTKGRQSADVPDPEPYRETLGIEEDFMSMDSFKNDMEFFDEQNDEDLSDIAIAAKLQASTQEWELPTEDAHLLKQTRNISERPFSPGRGSSMSGAHNDLQSQKPLSVVPVHQDKVLPAWNSWPQVVAMIRHYSSKGDVQMSVTVLTVLRDQSSHLIVQSDEESGRHVLSASELTQWLAGYLDQLHQYKLWSVAAQIRATWPITGTLDTLPSHLSGGIPFGLSCGVCKRGLPKPRTHCLSCKTSTNLCAYW
jgi:WD40 repeat protein